VYVIIFTSDTNLGNKGFQYVLSNHRQAVMGDCNFFQQTNYNRNYFMLNVAQSKHLYRSVETQDRSIISQFRIENRMYQVWSHFDKIVC